MLLPGPCTVDLHGQAQASESPPRRRGHERRHEGTVPALPGLEVQAGGVACAHQSRAGAEGLGQLVLEGRRDVDVHEPAVRGQELLPARPRHRRPPRGLVELQALAPVQVEHDPVGPRRVGIVLPDQPGDLTDRPGVAVGVEGLDADVLPVVAGDQVVGDVTAQEGDTVGEQVGPSQHHPVLEPHLLLREGEPLPLQEAAAEQLLRRQGAEDLLQVGVHLGLREQVRDVAPDAERARDHDVAAVLVRQVRHPTQRVGRHHVVGVGVEHVSPPGERGAPVARDPRPPAVALVDDAQLPVGRREVVQELGTVVARAVVDSDDLVGFRPEVLSEQGVHQRLQVGHGVVDRHDDGDPDRLILRGCGRCLGAHARLLTDDRFPTCPAPRAVHGSTSCSTAARPVSGARR